MGDHHTAVDGLEATWRLGSQQIDIVHVHDLTCAGASREVEFAPGTDLVAAREQRPRWSRLWDAVRREFWAEYFRAGHAHGEMWRWD